MAKVSNTPNKDAYDKLCVASKELSNKHLCMCHDGTWHIVRVWDQVNGPSVGPRMEEIQLGYCGWEDYNRRMSLESLKTLHKGFWPDIKIGKSVNFQEGLSNLIWNYRLTQAKDWTVPEGVVNEVKNPLQRASKIAVRTYKLITPSADAKKFTSKAGLACLKIITDVCGESKTCTEGDLKAEVVKRGLEITPTHNTDPTSAWRFLQFYRPKLVESELIVYIK